MNLNTETKLYPPMALLWTGPMPYQKKSMPAFNSAAASGLSTDELRSIVSEMVD